MGEIFCCGVCFVYDWDGPLPDKIALILGGLWDPQVRIYHLNEKGQIKDPVYFSLQKFVVPNDKEDFIEQNKQLMIIANLKNTSVF